MRKDELLIENSRLLAKNSELALRDELLRKRFAKVLNRMDGDPYSSRPSTPSDLSWEEIFCECGKLMAFQDFRTWRDGIEMRMDVLKSELKPPSQS